MQTPMTGAVPMKPRNCRKDRPTTMAMIIFWGEPIGEAAAPMLELEQVANANRYGDGAACGNARANHDGSQDDARGVVGDARRGTAHTPSVHSRKPRGVLRAERAAASRRYRPWCGALQHAAQQQPKSLEVDGVKGGGGRQHTKRHEAAGDCPRRDGPALRQDVTPRCRHLRRGEDICDAAGRLTEIQRTGRHNFATLAPAGICGPPASALHLNKSLRLR
jgi:hypothetical protein